MINFLFAVLREAWGILEDASVFLLFGFLLAGVLAVLVPGRLLTRLVGAGKIKSVLWGSVLGAPLPLCSCGVLPTALGLRKEGATPGATVAFLVATPETGVDSISLTYALTDPLMTVFRPVAGVATAIAAGLATNLFGAPNSSATGRPLRPAKNPAAGSDSGQCQHAGDAAEGLDHAHAHGHDHHHDHAREANSQPDSGATSGSAAVDATRRIIRYGFVELLDDISWWLALGIVLSAVAVVAVPAQLFDGVWGGEIVSMLLMLILSIPLYTCASSSTPMAAALALKGLSPGAVLVFLLAGPATNISSLVVLMKVLGRRAVAAYLVAVVFMTLAAGFALNMMYQAWGLDPRATFGTAAGFVPDLVKVAGAVLLSGLLILSMRRTRVPDEWVWLRDRAAQLTGIAVTRAASATLPLAAWRYSGSGANSHGRARRGRHEAAVRPDPGVGSRAWPARQMALAVREPPPHRAGLAQRLEFGLPPELSREEATRAQLRGRLGLWIKPIARSRRAGVSGSRKETAPGDSFLLTGDGNLVGPRGPRPSTGSTTRWRSPITSPNRGTRAQHDPGGAPGWSRPGPSMRGYTTARARRSNARRIRPPSRC